jgi:hypothetical protein
MIYRCHNCLNLRRSSDKPDEILTCHIGKETAKFCPNCVQVVGAARLAQQFIHEVGGN